MSGIKDAFVTKLKADGSALIYSTFLGGSDSEEGNDIAVDASGCAYLTGVTTSNNFPVTTGAFQTNYAGGSSDAFVTKLKADGTAPIYSTYLGGWGPDYGYGITVDKGNIVYLTGGTYSSNFPITSGAFQANFRGDGDAFLTKLKADGSGPIYSTFLGGDESDRGVDIELDVNGSAYLIGTTTSSNFPTTPGAAQTTPASILEDAFVSKFSITEDAIAPEIRKMFGVASLIVGQETTLSFSITNPNPSVTLTGVGFVDTLPSGVIVTDPVSIVGSCGTKTTITPGGSLISLEDATLAPGATCSFRTTVKATTPGIKLNITTAVTSNEAGDGNHATASLNVKALQPPTLAKSFAAPSVPLNGQTAVIFELKNPNPTTKLTRVSFTDPLPAGMRVAKTSSAFGCGVGSNLVAVAGSSTITYSNGTLLPGETCRMFVAIEGVIAGSWSNTTTAVDSLEAGRGTRGFAVLDVIAPPRVALALSGTSMKVGVRGMFTVVITNPNSHAWVTGVGIEVNLPLGLQIAPGAGGCGGSLSAPTGGRKVTLGGASVSPGAVCQLRVPIDATRAGLHTIQSTNVVSDNGGTGNAASLPVLVKSASLPF